jgi:hypothetical protein
MLLQCNPRFSGAEGAELFRPWLATTFMSGVWDPALTQVLNAESRAFGLAPCRT